MATSDKIRLSPKPIKFNLKTSMKVRSTLIQTSKQLDSFSFWLFDKKGKRDAKTYQELDESEVNEIMAKIIKRKTVDSNTSMHSLEEEYVDWLTQLSEEHWEEIHSQIKTT